MLCARRTIDGGRFCGAGRTGQWLARNAIGDGPPRRYDRRRLDRQRRTNRRQEHLARHRESTARHGRGRRSDRKPRATWPMRRRSPHRWPPPICSTTPCKSPKASPLAGSPLTLLQAIIPFGSNRTSQLAVTRAYWKLSAAEGDYNWAVEEDAAFEQLSPGTTAVDQTEMATARATARSAIARGQARRRHGTARIG